MALFDELYNIYTQPARPTDVSSNPDYDKLMGFAAQPGDDAATQFSKGLQSVLSRNTPEGRAMTAEIAKGKLANQLAIQLRQQQMELAKQYPTYQHFVNTGMGTVLAIDEFGNSKTIGQENPLLVQKMQAETQRLQGDAAEAQFKGSAPYQQAQIQDLAARADASKAQAGYHNALAQSMPELQAARALAAQAQANARLNNPKMGDVTPAEQEQIQNMVYNKYNIKKGSMVNDPAVMQKANAEVDQQVNALKQKRAGGMQGNLMKQPAPSDVSSYLQNTVNDDF